MAPTLCDPDEPQRSTQRRLIDLRPDAALYSLETAASLYVTHPAGLPTPDRNALVVGPLGSGKTIMLKALASKWATDPALQPVYVDLMRWTSQIAGESETYSSERLSPRGKAVLDALSLAVNVALCESVGAFNEPVGFPETWDLFATALGTSEATSVKAEARRLIKNALLTGQELPDQLPSVFTVASALGFGLHRRSNSTLVLMIDQIDQVSAPFFFPIATLLRRSSDFLSILATRPCPAAPDAEEIPSDIVSGDHYRIVQLGRSQDGRLPEAFVRSFLRALPLSEAIRPRIEDRAALIANLMWPSLRFAINSILEYDRLLSSNVSEEAAWDEALREIARGYEDMVQDALRAYCPNPKSMMLEWRSEMLARRGHHAVPIGRTLLKFTHTDLFGGVQGKAAQALIRVALKRGIFLMGPDQHYIPGALPSVCELSPLVLVNDSRVEVDRFDPDPIEIEVDPDRLARWSKPFKPPARSIKRLFISYWMSDPSGQRRLEELVQRRFATVAEVFTGELTGSPRWSPEIISKIVRVDLVLCDLTTPRRDIFVEYGVSVGTHRPLMQCFTTPDAFRDAPVWIANRQNQYFASTDTHTSLFETSVLALLNTEPDPKSSWRRDSSGRTMEVQPEPTRLVLITPEGTHEALRPLHSPLREGGIMIEQVTVSANVDNLEDLVRAVRGAGTLVAAFDGTDNDYLTCVGGGIFATKQRAKSGRLFERRAYVVDLSRGGGFVPGLLRSHPQFTPCAGLDDLRAALLVRLRKIGEFRRPRK